MRFTIRRLMVVVAAAGLIMAAVVMARRSREMSIRAEQQAVAEQLSLSYADDARGRNGDPQRVALGEQRAAYHKALRMKYERAARFPWLSVEPDSPTPEPPE